MNTRDLMNSGHSSSGKGDKPRTRFDERWANNFNHIRWPAARDTAFVRKGNRSVKVYSRSANTP